MKKLDVLLQDIKDGVCQPISTYNKGLGHVVLCGGLIMHVLFDKDRDTIMDFDVNDKEHDAMNFFNNHGDKYQFFHVKVIGPNNVHFIYIKPKTMRPWMKKTIDASLVDLVWCIHRQFVMGFEELDEYFKAADGLNDIRFYQRSIVSEEYIPSTYDELCRPQPEMNLKNFFTPTTHKA